MVQLGVALDEIFRQSVHIDGDLWATASSQSALLRAQQFLNSLDAKILRLSLDAAVKSDPVELGKCMLYSKYSDLSVWATLSRSDSELFDHMRLAVAEKVSQSLGAKLSLVGRLNIRVLEAWLSTGLSED